MEPGGSMLHSQGLSNNPYPSRINSILRIDTYLFKLHSNSLLYSYLHLGFPNESFPVDLFAKILKAFLPFFLSGYMPCPSQSSRFNHPDYIR
jgi:hypothetical protein